MTQPQVKTLPGARKAKLLGFVSSQLATLVKVPLSVRLLNKRIASLLCSLFLWTALPIYAEPGKTVRPEVAPGIVVSLSDIHFNPFYDPSLINSLIASDYKRWQGIFSNSQTQGYGAHNADTNYNLLNSALENIHRVAPHPDFIIISGDFLSHDFQQTYTKLTGSADPKALDSFIDKTIAFVTSMIVRRFPSTAVYPTLGNNDSYCGDYQLEPRGQFLRATAKAWKIWFKDRSNSSAFTRTFPVRGSYSIIAPNNRAHRLIVLNTTFFSINYKNACGDQTDDPGSDEIKWFEAELRKAVARKKKVWLLYHIPPGIDVFATLAHQKSASTDQKSEVIPFWQPAYNQRFIDLLIQYSPIIVGSFAGHMHMDTFELIQSETKKSASLVHITPAISPLFGNNPAFELFSYNRSSFALKNYAVYYFDISSAPAQEYAPVKWQKEYSFVESYGQRVYAATTLQVVHNLMPGDQRGYLTKYETYYDVSNMKSSVVGADNWRAYWCGMTNLNVDQYRRCVLPDGQHDKTKERSADSSVNRPAESGSNSRSLEAAMMQERNPLKRFFKMLGPGLITGASDDDPSGIGTYAVTGASLGFSTLWTALFTLPLMTAVMLTCARIGMVSGMGLTAVLRRHYSRNLLYLAVAGLVIANTINAGADIGAIAAAINLLIPIPIAVLIVPIALVILALQIWGSYRLIAKTFKWLTLALFAYIGSALYAKPDAMQVLKATFIPTLSFDPNFLSTLVAILGTTISPYLFFWQASQEVEEEIGFGRMTVSQRKGATDAEMKYARWDVYIGMFLSNLVMYFIILATAATLFKAGQTNIQSAADAAQALKPLAGAGASLLLSVGLIGTGFLAVPILTGSSAYAVSEAFRGKFGLNEKLRHAKLFYGVIIGSTAVGLLINFVGINPIRALFLAAIINGFLAPPLLVIIMLVGNNRRVMGRHVNGRWTNILGWTTTVVMFTAAVALVLTWD